MRILLAPIKKKIVNEWLMKNCELLWYTYFFFSISIITSTTITITKCFFSFFQTLSKVVLYEKSQNTAMQNICCEQRTKKKLWTKKNSLKYKVIKTTTILFFLPDVEPALRAIERKKHFHFSFFLLFLPPEFFLKFLKTESYLRLTTMRCLI